MYIHDKYGIRQCTCVRGGMQLLIKSMDLFGHISRKRVNDEMLDVWEKKVDDVEVDRNVGDHVKGGNAERRANTVDAAGTIVT